MPTAPSTFAVSPKRLQGLIGDRDRWRRLTKAGEHLQQALDGRAFWSVTATAQGGIAELVRSYTALARGASIDARWELIEGTPEFFHLTRRIHNNLHGEDQGEEAYSDADRELYEGTLARSAGELLSRVAPDDIVLLHDPPAAGLIGGVLEAGAHPVWRCHVGLDVPNAAARRGWEFLLPYVRRSEAQVFSRPQFIWQSLDPGNAFVVPPTLDPYSPKNQPMNPAVVGAILAVTGLEEGEATGDTGFVRNDTTPGRVNRRAQIVETGPLPRGARVLAQISPWNSLKDPVTVIEVFAAHVPATLGAHLVIAGPPVGAYADEPEMRAVYDATVARWRALEPEVQSRVHLAQIPAEDADESAAIINALQRRASVVLQKSRGEGFGMTVLEAAWKGRPVVCSRVGGLTAQVVDGVTGFLIDRDDEEAAGKAITRVLMDADLAQRMGEAGRENVRANFLVPSAAPMWAEIVDHVGHAASRGKRFARSG